MAGFLEFAVHDPLHILPDGVAIGAQDGKALDGGVLHQFGLPAHVRVPLRKIDLHVGDLLPDSVRLLGDDATSHIDGIEDDRATRAGVYEVPVQADSGKSYTLRLKVIDRVAPVVTPRHVYSALGQTAPVAEDFIGSIKEYDSYSAALLIRCRSCPRSGTMM